MNRRGFLKSLGGGIAALAVASAIPLDKIQQFVPFASLREWVALEYLHREYNAFIDYVGEPPDEILVGRALFEKVESELPTLFRYTSSAPSPYKSRNLMFKSTPMVQDGEGWGLKFKKSMITHNPRKLGVISSM